MLLGLLAFAVTSTEANAQQHTISVTIPFNFTVGDTSLPAGQYTIKSRGQFLALEGAGHSAMVTSVRTNDESKSGTELVFGQYGDQYFLHEVLFPNVSGLSSKVAPSKAEKVARERAIEAHLPNVGEPTIVAVR
jgi:hypothetical protein